MSTPRSPTLQFAQKNAPATTSEEVRSGNRAGGRQQNRCALPRPAPSCSRAKRASPPPTTDRSPATDLAEAVSRTLITRLAGGAQAQAALNLSYTRSRARFAGSSGAVHIRSARSCRPHH